MVKDLCFEILDKCSNNCRFCSSNSDMSNNTIIQFTAKDLIGANHSLEEIREAIGCDSIGYLSMEGMYKCFKEDQGYCVGCFSGVYPVATPIESEKGA